MPLPKLGIVLNGKESHIMDNWMMNLGINPRDLVCEEQYPLLEIGKQIPSSPFPKPAF